MMFSNFLSSLLLMGLLVAPARGAPPTLAPTSAANITECMIYTQANIMASTQKGGVMAPFLAFQTERNTLCNTTTWTCHLDSDFDVAADEVCTSHGGVKSYEDVEICDTYLTLLQVDTGGITPVFRNVPICIAPAPYCASGTTHQDLLDAMNVCMPLPSLNIPTNRKLADMGPPPPGISLTGLPPGVKLP